jgi:hypothetical protein
MDDETGVCECGAVAEYLGPDPYASEMCQTYERTARACKPDDCTCWDEHWMCWDCHRFSCESL